MGRKGVFSELVVFLERCLDFQRLDSFGDKKKAQAT